MASTQSTEISEAVLRELSRTEYACSSLEPLSGGTANFIFKGALAIALADGTEEVAVKHGEDFVASISQFQLSTVRCRAEEECLKALSGLPTTAGAYAVRAPKLHYFNAGTNTQVQEYLADAVSLKDYALKHFSSSRDAARRLPCLELGRSLGRWLRQFHDWATLPEQAGLREAARSNEPMRQLKHTINYAALVETVARYPDLLGDAKETFEKIKQATAEELQRPDLRVIHGDFWTGNALLPDRPLTEEGVQTPVLIVDWEMCQFGLPPLDLGQMIAELYELSLFKGIDEGNWLIEGFVAGYGSVDVAFAFRTALHAGTHLVAWGSRVAGWGSETQVRHVVAVGKEVVLRAWHKDRAWFEAGDLACLFGSR